MFTLYTMCAEIKIFLRNALFSDLRQLELLFRNSAIETETAVAELNF